MKGTGSPVPVAELDEERMSTIADIFDALTASDRPYKSTVPVARALEIIESGVRGGRCDGELFKVFVGSGVYKLVAGGWRLF